jgi:hypothetical protein
LSFQIEKICFEMDVFSGLGLMARLDAVKITASLKI